MEFQEYAQVTEAVARAIIERARLFPAFLYSNEDNSFTAVFQDRPAVEVRSEIEKADETITVLMPEPLGTRQPNVEPNIKSTVRFAFTERPEIDLTE